MGGFYFSTKNFVFKVASSKEISMIDAEMKIYQERGNETTEYNLVLIAESDLINKGIFYNK